MAKDEGAAKAGEAASADAEARPKKRPPKKGRKRRKERTRRAPSTSAPRPGFAAHYPRDPHVDELLEAFAAGNYAFVRAEAPKLADRADDEDVRLAALDLRRRIEPPTTAKFLWGLAMALLGFLFSFYLSHGH